MEQKTDPTAIVVKDVKGGEVFDADEVKIADTDPIREDGPL